MKGANNSLVDNFGRTITYLRLSITDRCNLRCMYCMPSEGIELMSHNEVLRFEEILKICRVLASMGINSVRVTGGEPLVRCGAVDFIRELKAVDGIKQVNMTTNGVLLGEHIEKLAAAGIDNINVSLDTLDKEKFRYLTKGEGFENIFPAIEKALELGIGLKINCVPLKGFNEDEIGKFANLAKNKTITVRFIELMPLGRASSFTYLPADKVISLIEKSCGPLHQLTEKTGNGPAVYYTLPGFAGNIGIISAVNRGFCKECNRLRLSAAGILKPCLAGNLSVNLRSLVRDNSSEEQITKVILKLAAEKPAGYNFNTGNSNIEMFRIGG